MIPIYPDLLTQDKKVMDALNLIKVKQYIRVNSMSCSNGIKQKCYLKYRKLILSPTVSLEELFATM